VLFGYEKNFREKCNLQHQNYANASAARFAILMLQSLTDIRLRRSQPSRGRFTFIIDMAHKGRHYKFWCCKYL